MSCRTAGSRYLPVPAEKQHIAKQRYHDKPQLKPTSTTTLAFKTSFKCSVRLVRFKKYSGRTVGDCNRFYLARVAVHSLKSLNIEK